MSEFVYILAILAVVAIAAIGTNSKALDVLKKIIRQ